MRPGNWEIDRSHPLAQGLAFLSLLDEKAGRPVDLVSASQPTTFGASWDYNGLTHSGTGKFAEWTLAPVVTGNGVGTGDFTLFAYANPVSESTFRYLVSQKNDALGTPFSQASLVINGTYPQANNSGSFALAIYSAPAARGANANVSSLLDGNAHLFVGVRRDSTHSLYFDGALLTNSGSSDVAVTVYSSGQFFAVGSQGGSTSNAFNRQIQFAGAYNRALSPAEIALLADRTDPMLGGLIVEERPVLYFDMGESATHDLTPTDLVVGSPSLGTPALSQVHALTATGLTTSSPVIGTPAVGQVHALAATNFATGSPVLGSPAIGQKHALTASGLTVSAPVLGTPSLVENENPVDALTANDLVVGSPVLGTPSLGQIHVLGSDGLVTGSPVLGSPSITQIHTLEALGLTVGVPVLGTPALNSSDIVLIPPDEVRDRVVLQARTRKVILDARNRRATYGA